MANRTTTRRGGEKDAQPHIASRGGSAIQLTERERQFVEHFMATGNATKAAEQAGYSRRSASQIAYRLLRKAEIQRAIAERSQNDPVVWTREQRQRFWTAVASGTGRYGDAAIRDRLKASELLGRSQADFVERHHVDSGPTLAEIIAGSRSLECDDSSRLAGERDGSGDEWRTSAQRQGKTGLLCGPDGLLQP